MMKRLLLMAAGTALAVSFVACGSSTSPTPTPTPTPPPTAQITMRLDPSPVIANYEGGGWYRFKVNMEFVETGGVGFTITNIHYAVVSAATGNTVYSSDVPRADVVPANGRTVLQFTSQRYSMAGGTSGATTTFIASFLDNNGHTLTATTQVTILHNGEPRRLP